MALFPCLLNKRSVLHFHFTWGLRRMWPALRDPSQLYSGAATQGALGRGLGWDPANRKLRLLTTESPESAPPGVGTLGVSTTAQDRPRPFWAVNPLGWAQLSPRLKVNECGLGVNAHLFRITLTGFLTALLKRLFSPYLPARLCLTSSAETPAEMGWWPDIYTVFNFLWDKNYRTFKKAAIVFKNMLTLNCINMLLLVIQCFRL